MSTEFANEIRKGADLSECGKFRFRLWRYWGGADEVEHFLTVIMLNPSTADSDADDPTIRRLYTFAKAHGFNGVEVVNLFALRATDPKILVEFVQGEFVGISAINNGVIKRAIEGSSTVLCAWGAHKSAIYCTETLEQLKECKKQYGHTLEVVCLGVTQSGQPRHPLYVKSSQPFVEYQIEDATP